MQSVLITGGLGFIGSSYAKLLSKEGYAPVIIDNNTYAADIHRLKDNENLLNNIYIGNICDKKLIRKIITEHHNIDTVVNFAAETMVDRSIKDSTLFIHSNIVGVQELLDLCRKFDLRFIQISTDEVYGSTTYDDQAFKETDRLNPGNPYAASKASADLLTLSYHNTYGLDCCITRSSNNFGEYQDIEKFIPRMITLAIEGKDLEIYGDGSNVRDWLWVKDNCEAIKLVMEKSQSGEIYNIGAGNEFTNNQIANLISNKFNVGIKYIEDRKGHDYRYSVNFNKIMRLGWDTKTTFKYGIEKTIEWYKKVKL